MGKLTGKVAIITGATYTPATTTEDFNAGLNVANLSILSTAMASSPARTSKSPRVSSGEGQV